MFEDDKEYSVNEIKEKFNQAQQNVYSILEKRFKTTMERFNEYDDSIVFDYMLQNAICLNELYYELFIHDKIKEVEKYYENKQNKNIQI